MKSIAVMGASGRMGQEVIRLLEESRQLQFSQGVAQNSSEFLTNPNDLSADQVHGVIDFSLPDGFEEIKTWCVENKVSLVSGTTGLGEGSIQSLVETGKSIPVLWSPNMSLGVAFVKKLLSHYGSISHFDFAIDEVHHKQKKDAPSGTALFLQEELENSISKPVTSMNSIRGGGVFGIHKVWAISPDETITLEHTAMNRSVFAAGAVKAMEWLVNQPNGFYSLSDVLGDD